MKTIKIVIFCLLSSNLSNAQCSLFNEHSVLCLNFNNGEIEDLSPLGSTATYIKYGNINRFVNVDSGGVNFDGVIDNYISFPDRAEYDFSYEFTFVTWINSRAANRLTNSRMVFVGKDGEFLIGRNVDGYACYAIANSDPGWTWVDTDVYIPSTNSLFFGFTYENGLIRIYINGIKAYEYQGNGSVGDVSTYSEDLRIANRSYLNSNAQPFHGIMDYLNLFDRSLSELEMSFLFQQTAYPILTPLRFLVSADNSFNDERNPFKQPKIDGVTLTSGRDDDPNQSLLFNGNDSHISYGTSSSYDFDDSYAFSFAGWIKNNGDGNGANGGGGVIINSEGEYEVAVFADNSLRYALGIDWRWINTGIVIPDNEWHHIALTFFSSGVLFYYDGVIKHRHSYDNGYKIVDVNSGKDRDLLWLGGRSAVDQFFNGQLDDIRLYGDPVFAYFLSSYEVALLAQDYIIVPPVNCENYTSTYLGLDNRLQYQVGMFSNLNKADYDSISIMPEQINTDDIGSDTIQIYARDYLGKEYTCEVINEVLQRNVDESGCTGAIGDVKYSVLMPLDFAKENGDCWVPLDGRSVKRDKLGAIGYEKIPDGRGLFIRAHDNRVTNRIDKDRPFGTPVGTKQEDAIIDHQHSYTDSYSPIHSHKLDDSNEFNGFSQALLNEPEVSETTGGSEVRPKNINFHTYIRIR